MILSASLLGVNAGVTSTAAIADANALPSDGVFYTNAYTLNVPVSGMIFQVSGHIIGLVELKLQILYNPSDPSHYNNIFIRGYWNGWRGWVTYTGVS